ncbi:asparagine synthase (glutamine-hydrolyzing) [Hyalangium rubrum]|uniref:asparagine synthase (glutamine-hydrolyzing) n=1 Tax=Hyalangium rubrum TaxID=3103134 RepID=A0ABU5HEI1_9BACT|nr:asparagine synthase (glutamine-hydrolyzing) [Hyalangium sp. s54d21]MDY7231858.1 asparagine synthase (glutamine-hydrolyzing) [Hyalangium sp. s54d21]
MCGIAGVHSLEEGLSPPTLEQLGRMAAALRHRGPDASGLFRDARAGLAHTRLAIVDPAGGQQPLGNAAGTVWLVFNGEIFNHVELRQELEAQGHTFRTRCDTEVVLQAYERWGPAAFERFDGQWAVALWDTRERMLVLSRDPLGIRPLYLRVHGGRLYLASEVKALFAAEPSLPRELDPVGLDETFTFWTAVAPQTVFRGVTELEPGHTRVYRAGGRVQEHCYWRPRFPPEVAHFGGSLTEAAEAVGQALRDAVRLQVTRADVPVGSYLSGGLDSSLVAALGRQMVSGSFFTFSMRFTDAEFDETEYQRLVAQRIGSEHRELLVSRADIAQAFPRVIEHTERPLLRTAPVPLFLLSRLVRDSGLKVVLTGEGADEVFAGYDLFREAKVRRFWARQPGSSLRPRLLERLYPYLTRSPVTERAMAQRFFGRNLAGWRTPGFSHEPRWHTTSALKRLFSPGLRNALQGGDAVERLRNTLPEALGGWDFLAQDQYLEMRTLLSGYLLSAQGDRVLMGHSVEGRFPFLHAGVVALAASLPPSFKLRGLDEKHVLKRAGRELLPPAILERTKQPYRAPDAGCFVEPAAREWVEELLCERALEDSGLFEPRAVGQLWRKCLAQGGQAPLSNSDNMALVGVLSTQLLHFQRVRRAPESAPPAPPDSLTDLLDPSTRLTP